MVSLQAILVPQKDKQMLVKGAGLSVNLGEKK